MDGILAFLLPFSSFFLGYELILSFTRLKLHFIELIGAAFPIGMALSSFVALCFNPILHCNLTHFYVIVLASLLISIMLFIFNRKLHYQIKLPKISTLIWLLICEICLIYIAYTSYIAEENKMIQCSENDIFLEISYTSSFLHGINYDKGFLNHVMLPLVSGSSAKSEYLPSIYLALLQTCGLSIQWSIFITTVLLFISISLLQYSFTYKLCQNEYASALSVPVIFLSGGFGFFHFLRNRDRNDPSVDYIFYLGSEKLNAWGHPMLHCILTSRSVELTMSLSILCFILLEAENQVLPIIITYFVLIIRPQTAVALSLLIIFYKFKFDQILTKSVCLIPIFLLLPFFGVNVKKETALFLTDYHRSTMFPFLSFPFSIFGVLFFTLIFSITEFKEKLISSLSVFYLLQFYSFQPNLRFNFFTILSTILPIFISISFSGMIKFSKKWQKNPDVQGVFYSLIFFSMIFMCLSSFTGIWARHRQKFTCWDKNDIDIASWIIKNTKRSDAFISDTPRFWNPATSIAGRSLYLGNLHWMQCTPFDNGNREQIFEKFVNEGIPIPDINYYLIPKNGKWIQQAKMVIGNKYLIAYENEKYILLTYNQNDENN